MASDDVLRSNTEPLRGRGEASTSPRCSSTSSNSNIGALFARAGRACSKKFRNLSRVLSSGSTASSNSGGKLRTWKSSRSWSSVATDYEFIEECGRGASSTVIRAVCKVTRKHVAVKRVDLNSFNCDMDIFIREAAVMRQMRHPNLLPLLSTVLDNRFLWLVTPYVSGGTVENILHYAYPQGFPEMVIATVAQEVLKALKYLHDHGIAHRDIKTSNILLGSNGDVYLGDLGAAAQILKPDEKRPEVLVHLQRYTFTGTLQYMSPELVEGIGYDEITDIWSLGITLYEMATGHRPYCGMNMRQCLVAVLNDDPPQLPHYCSPALRDLVNKCLIKDPHCRCTAAQLLHHAALKKLARDADYLAEEVMPRLPAPELRLRVYGNMEDKRLMLTQGSSPASDTILLGSRVTTTESGGKNSCTIEDLELEQRRISSWDFRLCQPAANCI